LDIKFKVFFLQTKFLISIPKFVLSLFFPIEMTPPSLWLLKSIIKMLFLIISFPSLLYAIYYQFFVTLPFNVSLVPFSKPLTGLDGTATIASQLLSY